jgi:cytochrome P450/glutathione S-transferase
LTTATIYHPRMISVPMDPYGELARWVLDRQGIPYVEECHAPGFYGIATSEYGGKAVPVLDTGETTLLDARAILNYYEERAPQNLKLYPYDSPVEVDARQLLDFLFDKFGVAVRAWSYPHLLSQRSTMIRRWTQGSPWWERLVAPIAYSWIAASVRRDLGLQPSTIAEQQAVIEAALSEIGSRLADGRPFLLGDTFSAPDLALASLAAPIILPPQHGSMPSLEDYPAAVRSSIEGWRASPAGQFILRLYAENRPARVPDLVALGKHGSGRTFKDKLLNFLIAPAILRPLFGFLRRKLPILILGKTAVVTRFDDVVEILNRNTDFTLSQINAKKIDQIDGPFILGMDASPQYDRENATLHEAVRRQDLDRIRQFVAQSASELIAAARPRQRIDVVNGFARVVPVRLLASYFGMPGPNDPTMMRWMRDVFHYIFADLTNGADVLKDALHSVAELRRHMDEQIAFRKSSALHPAGDDVLGRLLALQDAAHPWLDDHAVRRNLSGVIVGSVDTTSKFVSLAIDELLRRPATLASAQASALKNDIDAVRHYAWEAVRFNPHHPLLVRFCEHAAPIAEGHPRSKKIPAGSKVYAATLAAMFDPEVFVSPGEFDAQRQTEYLHFGHGMHTCFGSAINGIQIPELLAALLRLPNLRRAPGSAGQILYDGPFPNRLVLEFDA